MQKAPAGSVCITHPNVPAVTRCACCGKLICQECIIMHEGTPYCSSLCKDNAIRTGAMVDDVERRKGTANFKRAFVRLVELLVIAALIGAGWWYYKNHKREIDSKINQGKQIVEQQEQKLKQKGDGLIRDSKYKKDRENLVK